MLKQLYWFFLATSLQFFMPYEGIAQGKILFQNPSFDGTPQDGAIPSGWGACNKNSTPDILPGPWGVQKVAADGKTFLGLITRQDGTWEHVTQALSTPLEMRQCYKFSVHLSRALSYADYNRPVKLRVWGGTSSCSKTELLCETPAVSHLDWRSYDLVVNPKAKTKYLIFEAYYVGDKPYKGNLLLDHFSPIERCIKA